jgi:hypothetical protein
MPLPKTFARFELFQLLTPNLPSPEVRLVQQRMAKSAGRFSIDHIFGACEERIF